MSSSFRLGCGALTTIPFALLALSCSSEPKKAANVGASPDESPALALPSSCITPPEPSALGTATVVGTGAPESCNNEALSAAAALGGDISFDCGPSAVTVPIDSTIVVAKDAIIDGGSLVTLDGQNKTAILVAENEARLALRGLTFTRGLGNHADGTNSGGAVRGAWRGTLDIRDCVFTDNAAGSAGEEGGGAVYTPSRTTMTIVGCRFERNRGGTGGAVHNLLSGLTVIDSAFVDNESLTDGGGGLYTDGASEVTDDDIGGTIELCGCRFQGNIGRKQGGGAYLFAYSPDHVTVNQCVFEDNQILSLDGSGALGGGLRVGNAQLDLGSSLFVSNHSDRHAGGLWVDGKYPSYVTNCTFIRNDAGVPGVSDGGYGGALSGGNLVMRNLTIAENWAVNNGGGIFNEDALSRLDNSIVSNNRANNPWGTKQACRQPLVGANNLQWPDPGSDVVCVEGTLIADPLLGLLGDNGGPTQTAALPAASPALGLGKDCPALDQRGEARPAECDLGAFELLP